MVKIFDIRSSISTLIAPLSLSIQSSNIFKYYFPQIWALGTPLPAVHPTLEMGPVCTVIFLGQVRVDSSGKCESEGSLVTFNVVCQGRNTAWSSLLCPRVILDNGAQNLLMKAQDVQKAEGHLFFKYLKLSLSVSFFSLPRFHLN